MPVDPQKVDHTLKFLQVGELIAVMVLALIGAGIFAWYQLKKGNLQAKDRRIVDLTKDVQDWKERVNVRDVEITDLRAEKTTLESDLRAERDNVSLLTEKIHDLEVKVTRLESQPKFEDVIAVVTAQDQKFSAVIDEVKNMRTDFNEQFSMMVTAIRDGGVPVVHVSGGRTA